ncbi:MULTISPECIES: hypothetical protein [unclassified Xanthomonas]|uniref:hypothetical protein n=1 Tax=unclassified Xanthomonas TaxID=2643310 RepID=UPI00136F59FB|nr:MULTISPECIES: hypothetical protein [unclassified Xanthomonas]MBB5943507.1 hypothetical protein [Xanthomonas sp. 3307]MXV07234.1 hypothetical protein [Xanthomonas sp. LMG 9002]
MSGLNISCGDLVTDEKSGSALERVLEDLTDIEDAIKQQILSGLDEDDRVLIEPPVAKDFVPVLRAYRDQLVADIGHDDPFRNCGARTRQVPTPSHSSGARAVAGASTARRTCCGLRALGGH